MTSSEAIVCEGYTDVIGFFGAGLPRAVATCGTALTEDHIKLLKRFTKRVVLAYDADEAGQAAAERVYEWEQRHEMEIAVLALPAGADPDELARSDPEGAPRRGARMRSPSSGSASTACWRPRTWRRPRVGPEPRPRPSTWSPSTRARSSATSTSCRSPTRAASRPNSCASSSRQPRRPPVVPSSKTQGGRRARDGAPERARIRSGAEIEALRLLVQRPTELAADLGPWLFTEGPVRRAYEALAETGSLHEAIDESDPAVADLLRRLAVEESTAEAADVLVRLVESAVTSIMARMENEARSSDDPLEYEPAMRWLKLNLDDLRGDEPAMDALGQLLAWLGEHAAELPC